MTIISQQHLAQQISEAVLTALRTGVDMQTVDAAIAQIQAQLRNASPIVQAVIEAHTGFDPT